MYVSSAFCFGKARKKRSNSKKSGTIFVKLNLIKIQKWNPIILLSKIDKDGKNVQLKSARV